MTMGVGDESEDLGGRRVHGHAAGDLAFTGFDGAHHGLCHYIPFIPEAGKRQSGDASLSTVSLASEVREIHCQWLRGRKAMSGSQDERWMRLAIELAWQCPPSRTAYSVGAVLVDAGGD